MSSSATSVFVFGIYFVAFVLLDLAPPILILFGAIDLLAALRTAWASRAEGQALWPG